MLKFGKKYPIIALVVGMGLLGLIFLMRNASDGMNAETTIAKGQKLYKAGNYLKVIDLFTSAIELDGENYKGYFSRGLCYKGVGNFHRALYDYDKAIELSPDSDLETLYLTRGEIKHQLRMKSGACEDMKESKKRGSAEAAEFLELYCLD